MKKNDKNHFLSVKQKIKVLSKNYLYINLPYVSQYFTEQNTERKLIIKKKLFFICPDLSSKVSSLPCNYLGGGKMTNIFQCKFV